MISATNEVRHSGGGVLRDLFGFLILAFFVMAALGIGYRAQAYDTAVAGAESQPAISSLMFLTLGAGILIAVMGGLSFLQSRRNRKAAQHALME
jgi:hypothetical protein